MATKCDLENDMVVNTNKGYNFRTKLNDEAKSSVFSGDRQRCQIFRETSAYEDVESVTSLFKDITMEIISSKQFDDLSETERNEMKRPLLQN